MFKTNQPSPDRSRNDRFVRAYVKPEPQFETMAEFAKWIDAHLSKLEANYHDFSTSKSLRRFFKRR